MMKHEDAWPFLEAVDVTEVYYTGQWLLLQRYANGLKGRPSLL